MKALIALTVIYGAIELAFGLTGLLIPDNAAAALGFSYLTPDARYYLGASSALWVTVGFWGVVSAFNLRRNLVCVRILATKALLAPFALAYLSYTGAIQLNLPMVGVALLDLAFAVLFLRYYPWRGTPKRTELAVPSTPPAPEPPLAKDEDRLQS